MDEGPYRTIGIIGGGTAGYLTALGLRRARPELRVTLIESPEIPIIGVGEATTPLLVKFLHAYLGKDPWDLFRRVDVTWKLGIRFEWGRPGAYFFNYAFDAGAVLEGNLYESDPNAYSLGSMLMSQDRVPILREGAGLTSLLDKVSLAYHLDNEKFVRYLREEALKDGVERLERTVRTVNVTPDGSAVEGIVTDDGVTREFDLYVDCSGFRSALLEGALGSQFISYADSLFTDTAVVASVPHGGHIKPYTVAETMEAGWCWNIPTVVDDHRGYVFSSSYLSVEEAETEMRRKNPGMGEVQRVVKFRSGRHEEFWRGNVVAVGNSYGFVEPLESTGIHMIVHEVNQLCLNLPERKGTTAIQRVVNRKLNAHWDEIRWFLSVHYKFNQRSKSAFWRECNAKVDISGAADRVGFFQERAPLTYRQSMFWSPEQIFTDFAYDVMLLGQKVPAQYLKPQEQRGPWTRRRDEIAATARKALSHEEAVAALQQSPPAVLRQMLTKPGSWVTWP